MTGVDRRILPSYAADSMAVPFVISRFHEHIQQDTQWDDHSHPTHELLWNDSGVSRVTAAARTWLITPVLGLWMPAGFLHAGSAPAGTRCNFSHFGVRSVPSISAVPVAVELTPLLRLLLERLAGATLPAGSRAIAEAAVLDVLRPAPHEVSLHIPQSRLLRPIVESVSRDPGQQRSAAEWARELQVSPRTITRAFQAETGAGFLQWVAKVRAQRAISLLARGEDLEEVAALLGYSSSSAFGAAFKRTTGFIPSSFRP
ncbi:AraC family transcriptional regulator [Specibacter sp. NPDC057265]|uniref:helix-turn-helix transcriptional regulator n=1 Tax=Specibacter sp. NPDC057265 TaxID=3346075 RepID=UPI003643282B